MISRDKSPCRIPQDAFFEFAIAVFANLGVPQKVAQLATRSMLDASLLGVETHGIESLEMYVNHLRGGGLKPEREPVLLGGSAAFELWDMQSGFGLASARILMERAVARAKERGIYLATVRN